MTLQYVCLSALLRASFVVAIGIRSYEQSKLRGVAVYPTVHERGGDDRGKVVDFDDGRHLELQRASVLAPIVLLGDYSEGGTSERYINGAHYERHLYENAAHGTSLLVKLQGRGKYHITGFINSTHLIEPIIDNVDSKGRTLHLISRVSTGKENVFYKTIRKSLTSPRASNADTKRAAAIKHAIEVYVISDYAHTTRLLQQSLRPLEYMLTFMYKVSLMLQQLYPPIRIALVGYQTTKSKAATYVDVLPTGALNGNKTLLKMRRYVPTSGSAQQSDLVILITSAGIFDISEPAGSPEKLGLSYVEGICTDYSVAVVKDYAGRYTGVLPMLHEIGHTLGCVHDGEGDSSSCPAKYGYTMSPLVHYGAHSDKFSKCSQKKIAMSLRSDATMCLRYAASTKIIKLFP